MKKNFNLFYQIMIAALLLIFILDMFFKIEYSSTKIEQTLVNINQSIDSIANSKDTLSVHGQAFLNDNIIRINDITKYFLSERSISFLFTILNILLIGFGFYLVNSFNNIKEKINNEWKTNKEKINADWETLTKKIINTEVSLLERQCEYELYSLFNKLFSRYLSLKNSVKSESSDSFNGELRYILKSELTEINKTIQYAHSNKIVIDTAVYDFGIDILNEIKSIPNQNYKGELPYDLLAFLNRTLLNLETIVKNEKLISEINN